MSIQSNIIIAAFVVAVLSFMATPEGNKFVVEQGEIFKPHVERAFEVYLEAVEAATRIVALRYGYNNADFVLWLVHFVTVTFLFRLVCVLPWLIIIPLRVVGFFL